MEPKLPCINCLVLPICISKYRKLCKNGMYFMITHECEILNMYVTTHKLTKIDKYGNEYYVYGRSWVTDKKMTEVHNFLMNNKGDQNE